MKSISEIANEIVDKYKSENLSIREQIIIGLKQQQSYYVDIVKKTYKINDYKPLHEETIIDVLTGNH